MKLSVIIAVLNSHEVVRRQLLWLRHLDLPRDVEIILLDDGSDPPLEATTDVRNLRIVPTGDERPWTWAVARNTGAKVALGEYFLMTDIDFILTHDAIETCRTFGGDKVQFVREFGVLDENGELRRDIETLMDYGLPAERIAAKGLTVPPHPNSFCIRRDLYWKIGGFPEDRIGAPYPQGEDRWFKAAWSRMVDRGEAKTHTYRPMLFMFPNGKFCGDPDYNPHGLFHNLSRRKP